MISRLIAAWPLERYQLWLTYADGTEGAIDIEEQLAPWSLETLRDVREFRKLRIDRSRSLIVWPSGVDLDAHTLYRELRRRRCRTGAGR
ncbi:MAG: hypothetical protein QG595_1534 [Pseudomonadota bacterium]|jgi:hypothetical protein|nr:DUF2442 domain-containing protein [Chromatiales bacterium]MDQ1303551.1 hypothetical protein [Pseudomonadota bacterium]